MPVFNKSRRDASSPKADIDRSQGCETNGDISIDKTPATRWKKTNLFVLSSNAVYLSRITTRKLYAYLGRDCKFENDFVCFYCFY